MNLMKELFPENSLNGHGFSSGSTTTDFVRWFNESDLEKQTESDRVSQRIVHLMNFPYQFYTIHNKNGFIIHITEDIIKITELMMIELMMIERMMKGRVYAIFE